MSCDSFDLWPDVDNEKTCGNCQALVSWFSRGVMTLITLLRLVVARGVGYHSYD